MRVAARPVKPSSGSVCTNRPADVRVARQQVQSRGVCASSQLHARGVQCALGRERTAQDGGALLLEQRAVIHRNEARDALPLLILVPEPDPGADLAGPHPFSVGRLTSIRCGANALDAHGVELRVHVLSQILVEPPVGGEAHLGIGLLRDPDQLLHFLGLELAVLVAADNAVDVEEEDAQRRGCHRYLWQHWRGPAGWTAVRTAGRSEAERHVVPSRSAESATCAVTSHVIESKTFQTTKCYQFRAKSRRLTSGHI